MISRPCGDANAAAVPTPSTHPAALLPASVESAPPLTKVRMKLPEEKNIAVELATMPAGDDMAAESARGPSTSKPVPFPVTVVSKDPPVGSCRMRALIPSVKNTDFCAESSAKPTLLSPPHAPTPSANAENAVPAIVDTAQKVGMGTAEGMAEDDAHAVLDALPEALRDGSAVVGPAEAD